MRGLVDGKYRIVRPLGRGGMAEVFEAEHVVLGSSFALKFAHPDVAANAELSKRFLHEARAAARIKNDYVARVTDLGTFDGRPYMVMELLVGEDLEQLVQRLRRLPVSEAVDYAIETLAALHDVHAAGIVHRDLKPSNLFLHRAPNKPPMVKLVDFGVSKSFAEGSKITTGQAMLGSPAYMSPEQLRSARDVDPRADIWSCGIILYELLTGEMPFFGENVGAVFAAILETDVAPPSSRSSGLPEGLDAIIVRCLQRDPNARWPNAHELALALAPYASDTGRMIAASIGGHPRPSLASLPEIRLSPRPPAIIETISSVPPAAQSVRIQHNDSMATPSGRVRRRVFTLATAAALVMILGGATVWKLHGPAQPVIATSPSQSVAVVIEEPKPVPPPAPSPTVSASVTPSAVPAPPPLKKKAPAPTADPIFGRH